MSSRALRKAQKEREEKELERQTDEVEESEEEADIPRSAAKPSIFALLDEDAGADEEEEAEEPAVEPSAAVIQTTDDENAQDSTASGAITQRSGAKRKKKKKKGSKGKAGPAPSSGVQDANSSGGLDEIDMALKTLSTSDASRGISGAHVPNVADPALIEVCQLLSVDTHHLNVANEIKRLFGRAAFIADREEEEAAAANRQRPAGSEGLPLAEAVKGKYSRAGAGLPAVIRKRNIFIPGKEDWPRATGGGLGMEIVEHRAGGIVEYRFVHNKEYQQTQRQYEMAWASMNPSAMVQLLMFYPYHVATLMQVSEIAKHEKDYYTSGELLERALFSFGRAVHSTFASNLIQGKARLSFRRPENREFWLACWRYIGNLSMRATFRTTFEWAKLLLSLAPEEDPYCISLLIDQLALRAKQPEILVRLCNSDFYAARWADLPNIQFSRCLASKATSSDPEESKKLLGNTIERFPWVAGRLLKELDVEHLPRQIWGKAAQTDSDSLHCELYATCAKDIWKSSGDATAFLIRASTSCREGSGAPVLSRDISRDEARFVILLDKPQLISLLPREMTSALDNAADPLPPEDAIIEYESRTRRRSLEEEIGSRPPPEQLLVMDPQGFIEELSGFNHLFSMLFPGFEQAAREGGGSLANLNISEDAIDDAISRSRLSPADLRACLSRLVALRTALLAQPLRRVRAASGDEIEMLPNGMLNSSVRVRRGFPGAAGAADRPEVEDDAALARQLMEEVPADDAALARQLMEEEEEDEEEEELQMPGMFPR